MNSFMTPRLMLITSFVKRGASVIDVGSDHAYIPIYLICEKLAKHVMATDINDGPIRRMQKNISAYGLNDQITVCKTDGLCGLPIDKYDTVIIAGMGGLLIRDILDALPQKEGLRFILQPMTAIPELRSYLTEHGFCIQGERLAAEGAKLYVAMEACAGHEKTYTPSELFLGRHTKTDALYPVLLDRQREKIKKQIEGMKAARIPQAEKIRALEQILQEMRA